MRIHIVGIAGTFMAGVALIARELGCQVSGCDDQIYPPMSDVLATAGIEVTTGYDVSQLSQEDDWVIIGNAYSRGHPYVEAILNGGYRYCSGPEWLAQHVLCHQHVLAVSGTHGKTTTSSLLAWLLESAGLSPSFLIGGAPKNFSQPARWKNSRHFVIEADEYDTAFFDKRSKFVHYRPDVLVMNNLEFDHADIFPDLS
ncbi:MAG: UDP-N-acetylmuramate:L-alanyl-gamma-D-glutamyl-meso-diaminopimelate ligase, partial [Legionellales bacterium]|nr:UDP-N-acetylmuramate:L-alanyl-gamma-D-glutamyl-meso-diaminopimelate ligase [Legionellales bacterium]